MQRLVSVLLLAASASSMVAAVAVPEPSTTGFFPSEVLALMGDTFANPPPCFDADSFVDLLQSSDMVDRRVDLPAMAIPQGVLANYLLQPMLYPTWNADYTGVSNDDFAVCAVLDANFTTRINVTFPPNSVFPKPQIVLYNSTADGQHVTFGWTFVLQANGATVYFGAHFYYVGVPTVNGVARPDLSHFISWQKIAGDFVVQNSDAFMSGLSATVQKPDVDGANCLERVYLNTGAPMQLDPVAVNAACSANPSLMPRRQ